MYEVIFYEDKDGNKPVEHYIDQLEAIADSNKNARVLLGSIVYYLDRLEDAGTVIVWCFFITLEKKQTRHLIVKLKLRKSE